MAAVVCALFAGCTDPAATAPDTGASATFDSSLGGVDSADTDADMGLATDVAVPDLGVVVCPGGPGCVCKGNADCDTALCIETVGGIKCAAKCVDSCPDGFVCKAVSGGAGDLQSVCVPKHLRLCDPCATSKDCQSLGVTGSACVDRGEAGRFCGSGCSDKADCPGGYVCAAVTTVEGAAAQQCVPAPGGPVCTCSALASQNKLATACGVTQIPPGASAAVTCKGVRSCGPEGLSACLAMPATAETCNGKDDDCDGLTDEGGCDDGNPCTADACGPGGCSHTATAAACDADGSACTVGDSCQGAACVAGKALVCDDGKVCTADGCLPASGCTVTYDDGKGCDADGDACTAGDLCAGGVCGKGTAVACDDGNPCTTDACDKVSGKCAAVPATDGIACSDGTACTSGDACAGGVCAGMAVVCEDGNPCTDDACAGATGCGYAANAATCDDGNACTVADTCKDKACAAGSNQCLCTTDADCVPQDDGNPCTGVWVCEKASGGAAKCVLKPGSVVVCDASADGACAKNTCDAKTGVCGLAAVNVGGSCSDGNACTVGDTCAAGAGKPACVAGKAAACDDANPCTLDGCDPAKGCTFTVGGNFSEACYAGPADLAGKGACAWGKKACGADGKLGACEGSVLPGVEACNGADDDCNGQTDEACKVADFAVAVCPVQVGGKAGAAMVDVRAGRPFGGAIVGSKHAMEFWLWSWLTGLWAKP